MVKEHNCLVDITNKTQFSMSYMEEWYDSGRLADGFRWPKTINAGEHQKVLMTTKETGQWQDVQGTLPIR